jgi:hypothetical protein
MTMNRAFDGGYSFPSLSRQRRDSHWPLFQGFDDRVARSNKLRSRAWTRPHKLAVAPDARD